MRCDYTRPGSEPWWEAPHAKQESAKPSPPADLPKPEEFNLGDTGLSEYIEKAER